MQKLIHIEEYHNDTKKSTINSLYFLAKYLNPLI